jgi:HD-like signal output (HDOD) protein
MSTSLTATIRERVQRIETMPAIPAVFLPLLKLLSNSMEEVRLDEVVRLVSYDGTIAAQCLRMAGSPLFGMSQPPKSIKGAVLSLGLRRVETILLTCCLGQAFPAKKWVLDPAVFWRHSLGCALVCRKFAEMLAAADHEKAYMAGLLHDIGFSSPRRWSTLARRGFRCTRRSRPQWDSRTAKPDKPWRKNGNWPATSSK